MRPNRHLLSIAPMMEWTDRHCRYFHRLLAPDAFLYTEMIATGAINRGDAARHLAFDPSEHPVALQLGGAAPKELAQAAAAGAAYGYDEINLNCGCPSDRVQAARFGACLMGEAALVADIVRAMRDAQPRPVTVKHRIGIDPGSSSGASALQSYEFVRDFVGTVAEAGCTLFVVHARIAILKGLSPKENREVPPLRYEIAQRLKRDFPDFTFVLNGGLTDLATVERELAAGLDGAMIGRAAYHTPFFLAELEQAMFGRALPDRHELIERFLPYVEARRSEGVFLSAMTRHVLGLFQGMPGARAFRRMLSEEAHKPGAGPELLRRAASLVRTDEAAQAA
ncbi:MAG: tRNA dihydrouridine synthase DusA [Rhodospirillales bacterium]|nr:tRNA dihydrouridine synthase DusA [Rhodospirillales bacterium]